MISPKKAQMILNGSSNGVSLKQFSPAAISQSQLQALRDQYQLQADQFVFLAVGRVVKDKGIIELVAAFSRLQSQLPQARLFIIGPFEQQLDPLPVETITALRNNKAITHISWSDEIPAWMLLANCLVHASHREGFPNVVLQAAAMGCPLIVSTIPGNIDIVNSDEMGWRFPRADASHLFNHMQNVIENNGLALEKASLLQQRIKQYFDRDAVHAAILERYQCLLSHKKLIV